MIYGQLDPPKPRMRSETNTWSGLSSAYSDKRRELSRVVTGIGIPDKTPPNVDQFCYTQNCQLKTTDIPSDVSSENTVLKLFKDLDCTANSERSFKPVNSQSSEGSCELNTPACDFPGRTTLTHIQRPGQIVSGISENLDTFTNSETVSKLKASHRYNCASDLSNYRTLNNKPGRNSRLVNSNNKSWVTKDVTLTGVKLSSRGVNNRLSKYPLQINQETTQSQFTVLDTVNGAECQLADPSRTPGNTRRTAVAPSQTPKVYRKPKGLSILKTENIRPTLNSKLVKGNKSVKSTRKHSVVSFNIPEDIENEAGGVCPLCSRRMSTPELPPLADRSRSLSGSTEFVPLPNKPRKQIEASLLDIASSRSPHSFSSSSGHSHPSGTNTHTTGRLPRTTSWCATDQSAKLGTVFEQKLTDPRVKKLSNEDPSSLVKHHPRSVSQDSRNSTMGRVSQTGVLTNSRSNTNIHSNGTNTSQSSKRNGIKRIMSEPKMITERKNMKNSNLSFNKRLSYEQTNALTSKTTTRRSLYNHKHSSVDFNGNGKRNINTTNSKRRVSGSDHIKFQIGDDDDDDDDDESEPDEATKERVLQWLDEVDGEAEDPPEPDFVYEDTPPQTDSAIHIVYGES
ncbi:hypothetical protein SNE40_021382 [Patella caerulea]